jgi:hypothetical protein
MNSTKMASRFEEKRTMNDLQKIPKILTTDGGAAQLGER